MASAQRNNGESGSLACRVRGCRTRPAPADGIGPHRGPTKRTGPRNPRGKRPDVSVRECRTIDAKHWRARHVEEAGRSAGKVADLQVPLNCVWTHFLYSLSRGPEALVAMPLQV